MKKETYVVSPYTYGHYNNPTSWGVWNTETKGWTIHPPMQRKKDAEEVAKSLNEPW
ncbi:hypothetical protein D3C75_461940 [compost metagenome]